MKYQSLVILYSLSLLACSTGHKDYKQSDWYKNSQRQHHLPDEYDLSEKKANRALQLEEIAQTAGIRMISNTCPMRAAPNTDAPILRSIKKGQKLWTQDNGGEWFRVFKKTGYAFVNKTCFINASTKNYFVKK